jgi:FKBP-type peptidyl-prolyl cis-trans isomerase FkpA
MQKKNTFISFVIIIIFIILVVLGGMWAKKHPAQAPAKTASSADVAADLAKLTTPVKQVKQEGTGDPIITGDTISVNYVGALADGTVFDTNMSAIAKEAGLDKEGKTYQPLTFKVGSNEIIQGWNIAVTGMKKGEIAQVAIPASFAYGATGVPGVIPPNAPLVFQIQIIDIQKAGALGVSTTSEKTIVPAKTTTTTKTKK